MRSVCLILLLVLSTLAASGQAPVFEDVTAASGFGPDDLGWGLTIEDFNGDGKLDIVAANNGEENVLYVGQGDLQFVGEPLPGGPTNTEVACPIDFDQDGDLDLVCGCWGQPRYVLENDGQGGFEIVTEEVGLAPEEKARCAGIAVGDVDGDGDPDLYAGGFARGDVLLLNEGPGLFVPGPEETPYAGLRRTEHVMFVDVDADGDLDLFTSAFGTGNHFLINEGEGQFREATNDLGLRDHGANLGAAFFDYDNDNDLDLFLCSGGWGPAPNRLWQNVGEGLFRPATVGSGLHEEEATFGCAVGDVDLDGDLDLFVAENGPPHHLYLNQGDRTFVEDTPTELADIEGSIIGACLADLDDDGDPDLVVAVRDGASRIFRNALDSKAWLKVRPVAKGHKCTVGALVRVFDAGHLGEMSHFRGLRQIGLNQGWGTYAPLIAHFGVPADGTYDIEVQFPGGEATIVTGQAAGQTVPVEEP